MSESPADSVSGISTMSFQGHARDVKGRKVEAVMGWQSPTHSERVRVITGLTTNLSQGGEELWGKKKIVEVH